MAQRWFRKVTSGQVTSGKKNHHSTACFIYKKNTWRILTLKQFPGNAVAPFRPWPAARARSARPAAAAAARCRPARRQWWPAASCLGHRWCKKWNLHIWIYMVGIWCLITLISSITQWWLFASKLNVWSIFLITEVCPNRHFEDLTACETNMDPFINMMVGIVSIHNKKN